MKKVKKRNGRLEELNLDKINLCAEMACEDLDNVSVSEIVLDASLQLYDKIPTKEIDKALIMSARSKIEKEPNYAYVSARLLLHNLYKEVFGEGFTTEDFEEKYKKHFIGNIKKLVRQERLNKGLLSYDLDQLADALVPERDDLFKYLGIQTLYDRYFIHLKGRRMESPQSFYMRVAMGLCLNEENKEQKAIEIYNMMSEFRYSPSTPTLFNSGTKRSQLSSCYLSTVHDSIDGIFGTIHGQARLSKYAGGLGIDWSYIRATGSYIQGTNGNSSGLVPWLKIFNDTLVAVNQCFSPETLIYTKDGIKPIFEIEPEKDLVLTQDGTYRKVLDSFAYEHSYDDRMVAIDIKHGIEPIRVTDGHPIYSIRGIKKGNTVKRIRKKLGSGDICPEWVAAGHLTDQDFIGITVPCDFVQVEGFTEEDARLYGMMLADGHISIKKGGYKECGVAFNTNKKGEDFQFLTNYLAKKNIHYWITESSESFCTQVGWTYNTSIPISHEDLYDKEGKKRISSRLMHLPRPFALQMIRGMIDADGGIYRKNEVYFYNTSTKLVEGFRYQILKFGVPTSGNIRTRHYDREIIRRSGSVDRIQGTTTSYDIRIPAFKELADIFNIPSVTKFNWFTWNNILFTRVKSVEEIANPPEYVYDLKVEGLENYTTTHGLVHNGGKRKGAGCAYLEVWHLDVEDFLELRKNTGDDRRRCHDMNTALWICDEFMLAVKEERDWYLLDPHECPDLHDLYGQEFSKAYAQYCEMAENGELENFAKMPAKDLWKKCLKALFETGHPWITFKDPSNIRYSNKHAGVVHSSNLCTEILLHTKPTVYDEGELTEIGETAVCNLASINLANHVKVRTIDWKKLQKTVEVAVRGLDNVIDLNFYPTEEARNSNLKNRPVGLGVMGTHDVLHKLNINYDSQEAIDLCGKIQEFISLHAIKTSALLAKEKGSYPTFGGSEWDKGNFPIDTYCDLRNQRVTKPCVEEDSSLYETLDEWDSVRQLVADYGMRNSNVMAIAPTATISYIQGCSQSIEPDYSALYVYSTLSGEFTMVNEHFVALAKKKGIWSQELIDALKSVDGDVTALVDLSDDLKEEFKNAFDVSYETLIKAAAARQRWIDMGQSLNLYNKYESLKYLNDMYMLAWEECLKTTYYLRSKAATRLEKSTVSADKNSEDESIISKPSACSILDPGCESCQ